MKDKQWLKVKETRTAYVILSINYKVVSMTLEQQAHACSSASQEVLTVAGKGKVLSINIRLHDHTA